MQREYLLQTGGYKTGLLPILLYGLNETWYDTHDTVPEAGVFRHISV